MKKHLACLFLALWLPGGAVLGATVPGAHLLQHGQPPLQGIGGDLPLLGPKGQRFSLASLGAQPALVFFGFTRCATVCTIAFHQARQILAQFKAKTPPAIVFVTLDPLSDDPATLARHLAAVDPRIIGLTGSPSQVESVARRYGVGVSGSGPSTEHSAKWYLVNSQSLVLRVYDTKTSPQDMAHDAQRLLATAHKSTF